MKPKSQEGKYLLNKNKLKKKIWKVKANQKS
jgi:hypothetical protein